MVEIFTDGACSGNPGRGGYGVILRYKQHIKEISQGYQLTTNNRMELLAVIVALEALKGEGLPVTIYSDSEYIINSVTKGWLWSWEKKGFKDKKNVDLWKRFIPAYRRHQVKFVWVKGHAGHKENEACDRLAVAASRSSNLLPDEGFQPDE